MKFKNIKNHLPTVMFLVFIAVIGLFFCFGPKDTYSSSEKRYLEKPPVFTVERLVSGEFGTDFEKYLSDHTDGRQFFVGLNAYYDLASGRNGSKGVYLSGDDYLINDPIEKDNYLEHNIQTLANFAKNTGVNANLIIVPSTGYIMDKDLPLNHYKYLDEKYFNIIEKNKGNLNFINILDEFKNKATDTNVFYRTDHHWTTNGAYLAYERYCKDKGLTATPKSDFKIKSYPNFYGTTYSTSAYWLTPSENIDVWYNKNHKDNIRVTIDDGDEKKESESMYFLEHLNEDDKYPVFLDGNHSLVRIKNSDAKGGKLLLLKDSFSHCFAPFVADNYSEIIMIDMRYYKDEVSKLVKDEGITDVLMLYGLDNLSLDTDIRWLK